MWGCGQDASTKAKVLKQDRNSKYCDRRVEGNGDKGGEILTGSLLGSCHFGCVEDALDKDLSS